MDARDGTFVLLPSARNDLIEIAAFLGRNDKSRATQFFQAARSTFESLSETPFLGSIRPQKNEKLHSMRAWPVKDFRAYIIFYRPFASGNGVVVHRVLHHSRDVMPLLEESLEP